MKTAFIIFEGLTALDFVGAYDALRRLKILGARPDFEWDICAFTEEVHDETGLQIAPTKVGQSLAGYDLLVVPGGMGTRVLMKDEPFLTWLKTGADIPLKTSVCTGSLLMAAAGFLTGRRATTHPNAYELLAQYKGIEVVRERVVDEGDIITARGVTSSIDLGLYLCEKLTNRETRDAIKRQMDYPYEMILSN